jgi:hypothetical protein
MTLRKRRSRWYRFAAAEQSNVGIFLGICRAQLPGIHHDGTLAETDSNRGHQRKTPTKFPWPGHAWEFPPEKGISARSLFQRIVDVGEFGVEVGTEAVDHSDDRERNAGSNQSIFDGGGTGFVGEKPFENAAQLDLPSGCVGLPNNC